MDYEKAFKEALKAVKELQEANPSDDGIKNWVEEKFPELLESKDEKIRKLLIRLFMSNNPNEKFDNISTNEIIEWLEKQGQVKENVNSLTIQNGIILDGVVYELTTGFPDKNLSLCGNCELNEKCIEFGGSLCYFFADHFRKVFRKMERKS